MCESQLTELLISTTDVSHVQKLPTFGSGMVSNPSIRFVPRRSRNEQGAHKMVVGTLLEIETILLLDQSSINNTRSLELVPYCITIKWMGHQSGHPSSKRGSRVLSDHVAERVAEVDRPGLRRSLLTIRVSIE